MFLQRYADGDFEMKFTHCDSEWYSEWSLYGVMKFMQFDTIESDELYAKLCLILHGIPKFMCIYTDFHNGW